MSLEERISELTVAVAALTKQMGGKASKAAPVVDDEEDNEPAPPKKAGKGKAAPAVKAGKGEADKLQAHALLKEVAKKKGRGGVVEILKAFKAKVFSDLAEDQYAKVVVKALAALDEEEEQDEEVEEDDPLAGDD